MKECIVALDKDARYKHKACSNCRWYHHAISCMFRDEKPCTVLRRSRKPSGELEGVCEKYCGDDCKKAAVAPTRNEQSESVVAAPKRARKSRRRTAEALDAGSTRAKRKKAGNNTGARANHPAVQGIINTGVGEVTAGPIIETENDNNNHRFHVHHENFYGYAPADHNQPAPTDRLLCVPDRRVHPTNDNHLMSPSAAANTMSDVTYEEASDFGHGSCPYRNVRSNRSTAAIPVRLNYHYIYLRLRRDMDWLYWRSPVLFALHIIF